MSDRLKDLQRQRALAQEQQAQLDREIAREMGQAAQPEVPLPTPSTPSPAANDGFLEHMGGMAATAPAKAADSDADKIIDQYRSAKPIRNEVKRGCLIYLFAAFALVGLGVALLYLFHGQQ